MYRQEPGPAEPHRRANLQGQFGRVRWLKAGRMVGRFRRWKTGPLEVAAGVVEVSPEGEPERRSPRASFAGRGGPAVEVAIFEAVAVAWGEDFGVVDQAVDHGGGGDLVAEISHQALKGLFEVTIWLAVGSGG